MEGDKSIEVTVIPKKDIQEIIFSSSLASKIKKGTLNASLVINEKEYDFEVKIDKHSILLMILLHELTIFVFLEMYFLYF
mgnify:CR=1 FL=1